MGDKGNNEVQCPHCGHFVGAASRCTNCGARLERRMGLKVLRISALLVAVFGVFLLHLYARNRELPLVKVADISPAMNFASVRIEGRLEQDARRLRSGSVLYVVNDGSGSIAVFAQPTEGRLPLSGQQVSVSGSLSVGAGNELRLRAHSKGVAITQHGEEVPAGAESPAGVTAALEGEHLVVVGRVAEYSRPRTGSKAPYRIILSDGGGALEVVHWLPDAPQIHEGAKVRVYGTVGLYKGKVQLKVWEAGDIRVLE